MISLCMIVRDEQEMLAQCLESVKTVVDEIIVVDTGSSDATVDIARKYGAKVYEHAWEDDFSKARNIALSYATQAWILVLDADERLSASAALQVKGILQACDCEGLRVKVRDLIHDSEDIGFLVNTSTRFFRNRAEYRYERKIHEQIDASILAAKIGPPPILSNLVVDHYGYLEQAVAKGRKRKRNLRLAEREAQTISDGFSYYNVAVEYIRNKRYEEALTALNKSLALLDHGLSVTAEVYHRKAICFMEMEKFDLAVKTLEEGLSLYPDFTDLMYQKAEALSHLHRYRDAIQAFLECRKMGDSNAGYYTVQGVGGYRAAYSIGIVYHVLRSFAEALKWYRLCLKENPAHKGAVYRIAEVLRETVKPEQIDRELAIYFDLSNEDAKRIYLDVLFSIDRFQTVLSLAQELHGKSPALNGVLARGAVSALHCGDWELSLTWAQELVTRGVAPIDNLLLSLVSCWAMGSMTRGQQVINHVAKLENDMLRAVCQQMQWYAEGRKCFSLSIDFKDPDQNLQFHDSALRLLRLVVITRDRKLLSQVLPILSPLEGHKAWLRLGLYYYRYDQQLYLVYTFNFRK